VTTPTPQSLPATDPPAPPDTHTDVNDPSPRSAHRSIRGPLLGIMAFAFILRLVMVFVVHPMCPYDAERWDDPAQYQIDGAMQANASPGCITLKGDSLYVYLQGRLLASGNGLSDPIRMANGVITPSGKKPPSVAILVAALDEVGISAPDGARVALSLAGVLTVALIGLLLHRIVGRRAALIGAGLMAVHPMFVTNDWRLLTEPLATVCFVGALYATYRLWERPSARWASAAGMSLALASYSRNEAPLLWLVVVLPVVLGMRRFPGKVRANLLVTSALAGLIVLAPLWILNASRFENPSPFGPGSGWGLLNGTCDDTWYHELTGYLSFSCFDPSTNLQVIQLMATRTDPPVDESELDVVYRRRATTYIGDNVGRFPAVAAARLGRVFGVYSPGQTISLDITSEERGDLDSKLSFAAYYALIPLSVLGLTELRRRKIPISPIVGPVVVVAAVAVASFGLPRYRLYVDVGMVLAGAVGLDVLPARWRSWREARAGRGASDSSERRPRFALTPARAAFGGAGAMLVLLAVAVVVWSAGLEPPDASAAPGGDGGPAATARLCADLDRLAELAAATKTDASRLAEVPQALDALAISGPPSFGPDLDEMRKVILVLPPPGVAPTPAQMRTLNAQAAKGEAGAARILAYRTTANCPVTTTGSVVPTTRPARAPASVPSTTGPPTTGPPTTG